MTEGIKKIVMVIKFKVRKPKLSSSCKFSMLDDKL